MQNIWQKQEEIWTRKVGYSQFQSYIPHQPSQDLMILIAHLALLSCLEFGIMLLPLHLKPVLSEQELIFVNLNTTYIQYIHKHVCISQYVYIYIYDRYIHTYIHTSITLHYITIQYITLYYVTLHYITYIDT